MLLFAVKISEARNTSPSHRTLTAASPKLGLEARDVNFKPRSQHILHYVDENPPSTRDQLAAQVHLKTKLPTIALEDVDLHLSDIICTESMIELVFTAAFDHEVLFELTALPHFILITSHAGCNADGEREVYLIQNVSGVELIESRDAVTLLVEPLEWASVFESMSVEFSRSTSALDYNLRHNREYRKRDSASTTGLAPTSTSVRPSETPTATALSDLNVHRQLINEQLASFTAGVKEANGSVSADTSGSVSVSCKNCTLTGSISVVHGRFDLSGPSNSNATQNAKEFIQGGYIEFEVNNLAAYVELESAISLDQDVSYSGSFSPIPKIATVGPTFDPKFYGDLNLNEKLSFTYGFDMTVPDGSNLKLSLGNVSNSTTSGFDETTITAFPFQAAAQISLSATMGFKPTIALKLDVLDGLSSAEAGISLEIPRVGLEVAILTQKNVECNPANSSSPVDAYVFDTLLNIVPSVDVVLGAEAKVELIYEDVDDTSAETTLTSLSLPTACLEFDSKASTFAPAALPAAVASAASSGGKGGDGGQGGVVLHDSSLGAGSIAGIVIGTLVGALLLLSACIYLFLRRRKHVYAAPPAERDASGEQDGGFMARRNEGKDHKSVVVLDVD